MQQYVSYTHRTLELNLSDLVKAVREKDSITLLNKEEVYFRPTYSPAKLNENLELVTKDFVKSVDEIKTLVPVLSSGYLGKLMELKSGGGSKLHECYEQIKTHYALLEEVKKELSEKHLTPEYEETQEDSEETTPVNIDDSEELTDARDLLDEIGL